MNTRRCAKCGEVKPLEGFPKNRTKTGGHGYDCRDCHAEKQREKYRQYSKDHREAEYARRRAKWEVVYALKDVPCADCGIRYPRHVMDFDHLGEKEFGISAGRYKSLKRLLAEAAKCEVVCANCHRERTYRRRLEEEVA